MPEMPEFSGPERPRGPEIDEERLRSSIWREVYLANSMISRVALRIDPLMPNEEWDISHPTENRLARSLERARSMLPLISAGREDWRTDFMPIVRVDDDAFQNPDPLTDRSIKSSTHILIELIALSRVEIKSHPHDSRAQMPLREDMERELALMRQELGVAEEYDRQMRDINRPTGVLPPTLPGVNNEGIIRAIVSGRLRVGFPEEQP